MACVQLSFPDLLQHGPHHSRTGHPRGAQPGASVRNPNHTLKQGPWAWARFDPGTEALLNFYAFYGQSCFASYSLVISGVWSIHSSCLHTASFQEHLEPGGISKLPMGKLSSDFKGCKTKSTCASLPHFIAEGYGSFMKPIFGQTSCGIAVVNGTMPPRQ